MAKLEDLPKGKAYKQKGSTRIFKYWESLDTYVYLDPDDYTECQYQSTGDCDFGPPVEVWHKVLEGDNLEVVPIHQGKLKDLPKGKVYKVAKEWSDLAFHFCEESQTYRYIDDYGLNEAVEENTLKKELMVIPDPRSTDGST